VVIDVVNFVCITSSLYQQTDDFKK